MYFSNQDFLSDRNSNIASNSSFIEKLRFGSIDKSKDITNTTTLEDIYNWAVSYGIFRCRLLYDASTSNDHVNVSYGDCIMLRVAKMNTNILVNSLVWNDDSDEIGRISGFQSKTSLFIQLPYFEIIKKSVHS